MNSNAPLNFCFGSGETIMTFPTVRPNKNQSWSTEPKPAVQSQQYFNIYKRQFPKEIIGLIQSSRRTFLELQDECNKSVQTNNSLKPVVLRASRSYTEQLTNCIELLDDIVDMLYMNSKSNNNYNESSSGTFSKEDLEIIARKLEFGKIVFWLCQLLFLDSSSQLLGNMLADWANFYNTYLHGTPTEEEEMLLAQNPWKILHMHVLNGDIGSAVRILDDELIPIETRQDDNLRWAAETLNDLLISVPHLNAASTTNNDVKEFGSLWETWLIKVRHAKQSLNERKNHAPPDLINQLSMIFDILLGESQIIGQVTNGEYWARVAATLRWTDPMASKSKFVSICETILFDMEQHGRSGMVMDGISNNNNNASPKIHPVIKAFLDIENDLHLVNAVKQLDEGVMNVPNSKFQFPWMAAHLVDILVHSQRRKNAHSGDNGGSFSSTYLAVNNFLKKHDDLPVGSTLREYYIHSYATTLQSHDLNQIGLDYLNILPGQIQAKAPSSNVALSHVYPKSDRHAMKLLNACVQAAGSDIDAFDDTKLAICAARASHWATLKRFGQSMQWAIRSESQDLIVRYSKCLLTYCLDVSDFSALDAVIGQLDHDGNHFSKTMIFLIRYRDLQIILKEIAMLSNNDNNNAVKLKISKEKQASHEIAKLLSLDMSLPKKVCFSLLREHLLPMLDRGRPVVSLEDTFSIMHTLERMEMSYNKNDVLSPELPNWDYVFYLLKELLLKYQVTIDMDNNSIAYEAYSMLQYLLPYLPNMETNYHAINNNFVQLDQLQEAYNNKREEENEERINTIGVIQSLRYSLSQNLSLGMIQNA
jgi:hypothetical protein